MDSDWIDMTISTNTTHFRLKTNYFIGQMITRCHIILIYREILRCHPFDLVDYQRFAPIQFVCSADTAAILDYLIIGI